MVGNPEVIQKRRFCEMRSERIVGKQEAIRLRSPRLESTVG
jgi:hypothetical protein